MDKQKSVLIEIVPKETDLRISQSVVKVIN